MLEGIKEVVIALIDKPGILSTILLPLALIWLNNRHNHKMLGLQGQQKQKENISNIKYEHEDKAYSSLVKTLFDVQMLHVELSRSDCDSNCIEKSLKDFVPQLKSNQNIVAEHQLSLESNLIDQIYKFYDQVSGLVIDLSELKSRNDSVMVKACVSYNAQQLAKTLIEFKRLVLLGRGMQALGEMPNFDKCCGRQVTEEDVNEYLKEFDIDAVSVKSRQRTRAPIRSNQGS